MLMQGAMAADKTKISMPSSRDCRDPRQAARSLPAVDGGLRRHDAFGSWRLKLLAMLMQGAMAAYSPRIAHCIYL
jgi:hypothetical protein